MYMCYTVIVIYQIVLDINKPPCCVHYYRADTDTESIVTMSDEEGATHHKECYHSNPCS
jgi:hypothetical protein